MRTDWSRNLADGYLKQLPVISGTIDDREHRYCGRKVVLICARNRSAIGEKSDTFSKQGKTLSPDEVLKVEKPIRSRSLNSNDGWTVNMQTSLMNMRLFAYSKEIRSAVLMIHSDKAHSCYMSRDAYANMVEGSKYADNKELLIIPGASHTDLYDGGGKNAIPFDKLQRFFEEYLK